MIRPLLLAKATLFKIRLRAIPVGQENSTALSHLVPFTDHVYVTLGSQIAGLRLKRPLRESLDAWSARTKDPRL